jgi:4-hydroxy-tetrahydrodipicolinate synthase
MLFQGSITALITPFKANDVYKVDYDALEKLIERQIQAGTHGIVPCGTTGESPTLSNDEHDSVIEFTIKVARGRVKILAGTGSNSTREAIERTHHAEKAGADGALIMTPYYNKPTQEGLFQHFKAIHDNTEIPIVLYNIPGRSVVDMKNETIGRIATLNRIVGIKEATGDTSRVKPIIEALPQNKKNPEQFAMISGDDETAIEFNRLGGVGCISVTSNLFPDICAQIQNATLAGNFDEAKKLNEKIAEFHKILFAETSPAPVKYLAEKMGLCSGGLRLPLVTITAETKQLLDAALNKFNS